MSGAQGVDRAAIDSRTVHLRRFIDGWRRNGVRVIDPMAFLCGKTTCDIVRAGRPLYFDSHHPSLTAARLIVARAYQ